MISVAAAWPRKLLYGVGALDQLGTELSAMQARKAMLVTEAYVGATDGAGKAREAAKCAGFEMHTFDQVEANPCEGTINSLARDIVENSCQVIVSLGGGSVIDCAKAANVVATHGGSISDYQGNKGGTITDKVLPQIAIPTTAGSGSEVTPVAVVTDLANRTKYAVSSPHLIPCVAILDPVLTLSMSPQLTAWTGMDALCHAIEAYSSPIESPIANSLAIDAVERIANYLPVAVRSGRNLQARSEMLLAADMAGIAVAQNELGLVHALAHQISGEFGVENALANAILLPVVMQFNREFVQGRYARVAEAMGRRVRNLTASKAADKAVQAVRELAAAVGIPGTFEGLRVTEGVFHRMAGNAMADALSALNPRPVTICDAEDLLRQVL